MSAASLLQHLYLSHFAKPSSERIVFRTIQKARAGHLVAIGLGDGQLARNMILLAQRHTTRARVRFTGIDLFEMRSKERNDLPLKRAHRMLHSLPARIQLVPGDPFQALARHANSLLDSDLVVIRADQLGRAMDRAWFYLPRMLHENSLVLVNQPGKSGKPSSYEVLDRHAVQRVADANKPQRKAA